MFSKTRMFETSGEVQGGKLLVCILSVVRGEGDILP